MCGQCWRDGRAWLTSAALPPLFPQIVRKLERLPASSEEPSYRLYTFTSDLEAAGTQAQARGPVNIATEYIVVCIAGSHAGNQRRESAPAFVTTFQVRVRAGKTPTPCSDQVPSQQGR